MSYDHGGAVDWQNVQAHLLFLCLLRLGSWMGASRFGAAIPIMIDTLLSAALD